MWSKILILLMAITLLSCTKTFKSLEEYTGYLADETNGLLVTKTSGGLAFKMKYLPPEVLTLRELKKENSQDVEKIMASYQDNFTFVLSIEPTPDAKQIEDIMYLGVASMEDYQERVHKMNFEFHHYLSIKIDDDLIYPVLTQMENSYSLEKGRRIILVFSNDQINQVVEQNQDLKIEYNDHVFLTGIHKFLFKSEDIKRVPKLNLEK